MPSTPARMVLAVIVTCLVSATALTLTYGATKDRIAEQERVRREAALREALPGATTFTEMDADALQAAQKAAGDTQVTAVFEADTGQCVLVAPRGYGGPIQMVMGLDRDGKVTGVSIITQNETPGLGTKILTEEGFLGQFVGWDAAEIPSLAKEFDAISGATKSSNGVRAGVVAAGAVYDEIAGGGSTSDE